MSTSGGPRLKRIGRSSSNLVLCLDARNANSYAGEPTTNLSANSDYSGAALNNKRSRSNSGWGTTFDNFITEIKGPGGKTVRAYNLQLTGATGSVKHAEGAPYEITSMDSQYASLSSGNSYRVSAWAKVIRADGSTTSHSNSNILYLTGTASLGSSTMTVGTEWTKISRSFSISSTGNYRLRHYFYDCISVGDTLIITEPQIELKGYSTPYVYSSRSPTDGWVDLSSGANDGTLTNMTGTGTQQYRYGQVITLPQSTPSFASYLDFDGLDDYVEIADNSAFLTSKTWELWIKFDSFPGSSTYDSVFQKSPNWNTADTIGMNLIYGNFRWSFGHHWGGAIFDALSNLSVGVWYHAVGTVDMANPTMTSRTYLNGVAKGTQTNPYTDRPTNTSVLKIGTGSGGAFNGQIAVFNVYKEELTAGEIKSNFNQFKGRFGL